MKSYSSREIIKVPKKMDGMRFVVWVTIIISKTIKTKGWQRSLTL